MEFSPNRSCNPLQLRRKLPQMICSEIGLWYGFIVRLRVAGRIRRRLRACLSGFWNLTIAAGEAVPGIGGFMKVAGGIFVTLIEPVQDNSQTTLRRLSIIEEREEDMCKGVVVLRCWSEGDADNSKVYLEVAFHLYVSYQRRKAVHDGATGRRESQA
ncbi:hypothetical protein M422DRAFT_247409 [Sphaerobolus stellatus SS14]|nr:hypothetical protein M422DRAFT_247409 [Sphaerobolus stellatus SS14]